MTNALEQNARRAKEASSFSDYRPAIEICLILAPHLHEGKTEPIISGDTVQLDNGMLHIKTMKSLEGRSWNT